VDLRAGLLPTALGRMDHLGDIDHFNGALFVPVEPPPCKIVRLDAKTLTFIDSMPVAQADAPWCAVRDEDGTLFSSEFNATRLYAYHLSSGRRWQVPFVDKSGTPTRIGRVQGGTFTPGGRLFVAGDDVGGGIYGIDPETGVVESMTPVPRKQFVPLVGARADELEGLTYWDRGTGTPLCQLVCHSGHVFGDDPMSIRTFSCPEAGPLPVPSLPSA
jgi:hypothetical protein